MMSVIAELRLRAGDFELGRFFRTGEYRRVELETMVPLGEAYVPYVWLYHGNGAKRDVAAPSGADHDLVEEFRPVDEFDDRTLYSLRWRGERDALLGAIESHDAQLLGAVGIDGTWHMELRFGSHDALSSFTQVCEQRDIQLDVHRIYNPSKPDRNRADGLTERQREALLLATDEGYYDIPRAVSTVELAEQLDISDQAVTERLRRAIRTLVENSLIPATEGEAEDVLDADD